MLAIDRGPAEVVAFSYFVNAVCVSCHLKLQVDQPGPNVTCTAVVEKSWAFLVGSISNRRSTIQQRSDAFPPPFSAHSHDGVGKLPHVNVPVAPHLRNHRTPHTFDTEPLLAKCRQLATQPLPVLRPQLPQGIALLDWLDAADFLPLMAQGRQCGSCCHRSWVSLQHLEVQYACLPSGPDHHSEVLVVGSEGFVVLDFLRRLAMPRPHCSEGVFEPLPNNDLLRVQFTPAQDRKIDETRQWQRYPVNGARRDQFRG